MNYKAFYRTYRPTNFNEVIGQDHIVKTLSNIISTNKISHGYLFSGPRGTGKTSVAKIFANAINCIHSEKPEDICRYCLDKRNNSLDIIEIDAASNNGVNDIRTLREQVNLAPTNHPYKVYIIDEVHMLSKGAFNALLMTLEEPPKHAIFILATTDPDKIPETILSRVQRYNFKRITKVDLVKQLKFIFDKENIKCDEESLFMIATLANGSLRDALSIADQINAYSNSNINKNSIIEIFGLSTIEAQIKLLNLSISKKVSESLQFFDDLVNSGVDVSKLISSLINILKDFLIYKKTNNPLLIETTNEEMLLKINIKSDNVYKILDILIPLLNEVKYSDIPNQLTQLAIIKICSIEEKLDNYELNNNSIKSVETNSINSELEKNEILKDVTKDFFVEHNDEAFVVESPSLERVKTLEKTMLTDFNDTNIANRFNELINNEINRVDFSSDLEHEQTQIIQEVDKTQEVDVNKFDSSYDVGLNIKTKKETETFSFENAHTDEMLENTTNILNLDNEDIVDSIEVGETLIDQTNDKSTQLYDTNEISLNSIDNNHSSNKTIYENNDQTIINHNEVTKEFILNDESDDLSLETNSNTTLLDMPVEYEMTQPNIVNLFVLANKQTFEIFKEKLTSASLSTDEQYEIYSMLFKELKFVCSSNDYILVSSKEDWIINDLNKYKNTHNFKNFIAKYFGENVHFFSITRKDFETSRELLIELKKNNNLPKPKPLSYVNHTSIQNFNSKEINVSKETETKSKAIFGNIFKRKGIEGE